MPMEASEESGGAPLAVSSPERSTSPRRVHRRPRLRLSTWRSAFKQLTGAGMGRADAAPIAGPESRNRPGRGGDRRLRACRAEWVSGTLWTSDWPMDRP